MEKLKWLWINNDNEADGRYTDEKKNHIYYQFSITIIIYFTYFIILTIIIITNI